jgi:DNA-binding transcriptional ArsR family regulator
VFRYPARGIATLWETRPPTPDPRPPTPDALVALLGRTRAELLAQLGAPATTGDLARGLGVTPGAVSRHLGVPRASGLVATHPDGRVVLHLRTDRAEALLR